MKHSCCSPRVRVSLDRLPCYNSTVSLKLEGTAKPWDCLPVSLPQAAFPSSAHMAPAGHLSTLCLTTAKGSAACLSEQIKGPDLTWVLTISSLCHLWKRQVWLPSRGGVEQTELHQAGVQTPNCSAWLKVCDQAAISRWRAP